jgi:hypothetical protein
MLQQFNAIIRVAQEEDLLCRRDYNVGVARQNRHSYLMFR